MGSVFLSPSHRPLGFAGGHEGGEGHPRRTPHDQAVSHDSSGGHLRNFRKAASSRLLRAPSRDSPRDGVPRTGKGAAGDFSRHSGHRMAVPLWCHPAQRQAQRRHLEMARDRQKGRGYGISHSEGRQCFPGTRSADKPRWLCH